MTETLPMQTKDLSGGFGSGAFGDVLDELFAINELVGEEGFFEAVAVFLKRWIPYDSISIFEFSPHMQPRTLFTVGEQYDVGMVEYLSGIYLIDPLYELYVRDGKFGVFLFNLQGDEDHDVPETFIRYWRKVIGRNEIGTLMQLSEESCAHMSMFVSLQEGQETQLAVQFIEALHEPMTQMVARHLAPTTQTTAQSDESRRHVHETVSQIMADFGGDVLTAREKEIVHLLLRGHSAKSIARLLEISPGTAAIHRSNVYKKLGASGQGELFAQFVTRLISN